MPAMVVAVEVTSLLTATLVTAVKLKALGVVSGTTTGGFEPPPPPPPHAEMTAIKLRIKMLVSER